MAGLLTIEQAKKVVAALSMSFEDADQERIEQMAFDNMEAFGYIYVDDDGQEETEEDEERRLEGDQVVVGRLVFLSYCTCCL